MITNDMKISQILRDYPELIAVFVRISPHFKKLENKFLRKTLASRVNLNQAAAVAGINPQELISELNKSINPRFDMTLINKEIKIEENLVNDKPGFIENLSDDKIILLDVRPILSLGKDPFLDIMAKVKELKSEQVLVILNSFEPVPLYSVLANKGFEHWTEKENDVYKVYFFKPKENQLKSNPRQAEKSLTEMNFENVIELDVRELPPPEPMMKILESLSKIDDKTVLLVHHHREPVMLYPKLEERGFSAITNKINENYFKVMILRKDTINR